jgi:hypothetical protein
MHAQHRARWPTPACPQLPSSLAATTQALPLCPSSRRAHVGLPPHAVRPSVALPLSCPLARPTACWAHDSSQFLPDCTHCTAAAPSLQASKPTTHCPLPTARYPPLTREYERQRSPTALVPPCPLAELAPDPSPHPNLLRAAAPKRRTARSWLPAAVASPARQAPTRPLTTHHSTANLLSLPTTILRQPPFHCPPTQLSPWSTPA